MTAPLIGAEQWDGSPRPEDRWHLSASSVGRALAKPALEKWADRRTAEVVVDNLPMLAHLAQTSPDAAREFVRTARYQAEGGRLSAADRGTALHAWLEARLKGEPADLPSVFARCIAADARFRVTDEGAATRQLEPFLPHLEGWLARYRPELILSERAVYNPELGLAGRMDGLARLSMAWPGTDRPQVLFDLKTSEGGFDRLGRPRKPFADAHPLQLAALASATHVATWTPRVTTYGGGRFYLASDAELAQAAAPPRVDGAVLVQVTPHYCTTHPVDIGPTTMAYLVAVADAWRWLHLASASTVGAALEEEAR